MRCENCMQPIQPGQYPCPHCGYRPDPENQNEKYLPPGTKLGKYELGRVLGAGGFGITYIGWDASLQRKVAIKEYFPSGLSTRIPGHTEISVFTGEKEEIYRHGLERFLEEARLLMRFSGHGGIVSVYDVFEANATAYIVMEYLEGITLKQQISQFGVMDEKQLLHFITPAILTLKFLHQDGYVHRDIAPDNLMCLSDGSIKLLDFGAARYSVMEASQTLSVIVKQGFTPIEQYQTHGKQGPWTDVYAIGATMYYALTGKVPTESLERLHNDTIKSPQQLGIKISDRVDHAIMSSLNVQPEDRPQDLDDLIAVIRGEENVAVVHKRHKLPTAAIAGIAAAVVLVIGSVIGIAIHRGAEEVKPVKNGVSVPNIIGQQVEAASQTLESEQLSLLVTGGRYYDESLVDAGFAKADQILTQDPQSGTPVDTGSTVEAEISKGKQQIYMPDITDMLLENAMQEMEYAGFDTDSIIVETQQRDDLMPGTIISQQTEPNKNADYDAAQKIVVSVAPSSGTRPAETQPEYRTADYTGQDFDALREELLKNSIFLVKSAAVYSKTDPVGTVISQYPEKDTSLQPGEAVYVVVSRGIERTYVPDVRYLPLDEAKKALISRGLSWSITYIQDPMLADDLVASQSLAPHTQADFGDEIALQVSHANPPTENRDGPKPTIIPEEMTIPVGESVKLQTEYEGNETLFWASSDESILEVTQDGTLTPHRFGTATVIVAADRQLAFCTVTVMDDLAVLRTSRVLTIGDVWDALGYLKENSDSDAFDPKILVWRSTAPDVVSISENGKISAEKIGSAVVTASCADQVYQFGIAVEDVIKTVTVPRSKIEQKLSDAEKALQATALKYEIKREYNAAVQKDRVIRVEFTGEKDQENYYIVKETTVTLVVSNGANRVEKLEITKKPTKTAYKNGETPNYTGMELTATYTSGWQEKVTSGYTASNSTLSTDNRMATVEYGGKSVSLLFDIIYDVKLEVISKPAKTTYYIGDKLNLEGLKLRYTGADGKTKDISSGFSHTVDLTTEGERTVRIAYENVSTEFTVKVKKPSIVAEVISANGIGNLIATTDPAGQKYTWSVADPSTGYFNKEQTLVPLKSGFIAITATMIYNGISYQDTITVYMEVEEKYNFELRYQDYSEGIDDYYGYFWIESNIPNFDPSAVQWKVSGLEDIDFGYGEVEAGFRVKGWCSDFAWTYTVSATYVYNGKTYQASKTVTIPTRRWE